MLPGGRGFATLNRLDLRLVLLMGIALLPIGLIAMTQTYRMIVASEARTNAALMGETREAAAVEREIIFSAIGASRSVASWGGRLFDDRERCNAIMAEVVRQVAQVTAARVVHADGRVLCGTTGIGSDLSENAAFRSFLARPEERVDLVPGAASGGETVLLISQPLAHNGRLAGVLLIDTVHSGIARDSSAFDTIRPAAVVTFSKAGHILAPVNGLRTIADSLPGEMSLPGMADGEDHIFREDDINGREQIYSVTPLLADMIFTLTIWDPRVAGAGGFSLGTAVILPFAMWIASLAVAYFAVHALVVRHIRTLRQRMRAFYNKRELFEGSDQRMPEEFRELTEAFQRLTSQVVKDEAELENSLHEKDVLLREVHHRVKNNLQLIASMTSMQMRRASDGPTRAALRRLHDRVLGLATVHRRLYEARTLSEVRADELLRELANQLFRTSTQPGDSIDFSMETRPVSLYPDQAVPLSLFLTEAMTNALKYLGAPQAGAQPWLQLRMAEDDEGLVRLDIINSVGPEPLSGLPAGTGLGSQLIEAFATQLGGEYESIKLEHCHRVTVRFRPADFGNPEPEGAVAGGV